jgi:hypothetical protein
MDRQKQLESFTTDELATELKRRFAEMDRHRAELFGAPSGTSAKNPRMSEAKAAYWQEWREYKAAHPDATLEQWRRSQKRSPRK